MTKAYILTVFVYNGTVLIKHQAYAFTNKALAEHTRDRLKELNKSNNNKFRIAYSVEEAPVYSTIEQVPMFQDYQPVTNNDAPAQQNNARTQEPTDTAETSIADEEALSQSETTVSHLETPVQEQENNAVSTAASSTSDSGTTELATEAEEQTIQEQKPKSVRKITFKKTASKTNKKK